MKKYIRFFLVAILGIIIAQLLTHSTNGPLIIWGSYPACAICLGNIDQALLEGNYWIDFTFWTVLFWGWYGAYMYIRLSNKKRAYLFLSLGITLIIFLSVVPRLFYVNDQVLQLNITPSQYAVFFHRQPFVINRPF